jgi:hypothetical protein
MGKLTTAKPKAGRERVWGTMACFLGGFASSSGGEELQRGNREGGVGCGFLLKGRGAGDAPTASGRGAAAVAP